MMVAKFGNLLAGHVSLDIVRENTVLPYSFGSWWDPGYNIKQSDGEGAVILELWGM